MILIHKVQCFHAIFPWQFHYLHLEASPPIITLNNQPLLLNSLILCQVPHYFKCITFLSPTTAQVVKFARCLIVWISFLPVQTAAGSLAGGRSWVSLHRLPQASFMFHITILLFLRLTTDLTAPL